MSKLVDALRLAKRMCDEAHPKFNWGDSALDANAIDLLNRAPIAIAEALAEHDSQPAAEPVAWGEWDTQPGKGHRMMMMVWPDKESGCRVPLYTHPAPAADPLSDVEIDKISLEYASYTSGRVSMRGFARAIEARLKTHSPQ